MQVLHTTLYTFSYGTYKENLSYNQRLLEFAIFFFIFMTLMLDSGWYHWKKLDAYHYKDLKGQHI